MLKKTADDLTPVLKSAGETASTQLTPILQRGAETAGGALQEGPPCRHTAMPLRRHAVTPSHRRTVTPSRRHTFAPPHRHTAIPLDYRYRSPCAPVYSCRSRRRWAPTPTTSRSSPRCSRSLCCCSKSSRRSRYGKARASLSLLLGSPVGSRTPDYATCQPKPCPPPSFLNSPFPHPSPPPAVQPTSPTQPSSPYPPTAVPHPPDRHLRLLTPRRSWRPHSPSSSASSASVSPPRSPLRPRLWAHHSRWGRMP